jgi:hypothetical protein
MLTTRILPLCGLVVLLAGCTNGAAQDPAPIYQAVLEHELPGQNKDKEVFLFIDGKDPAPGLLTALRQQLPKLQAGSKAPQGKATRIDLSDMKAERGRAELRGTVSNGIDGKSQRFWLAKKNGTWVVEKAEVEARS